MTAHRHPRKLPVLDKTNRSASLTNLAPQLPVEDSRHCAHQRTCQRTSLPSCVLRTRRSKLLHTQHTVKMTKRSQPHHSLVSDGALSPRLKTFPGFCQCGHWAFCSIAHKVSLNRALVLISFSWPASQRLTPFIPLSVASVMAHSTVASLFFPDFLLSTAWCRVLALVKIQSFPLWSFNSWNMAWQQTSPRQPAVHVEQNTVSPYSMTLVRKSRKGGEHCCR